MAVGTLTLGIPGAGPTDFASAPIPSIVLELAPADAQLASRNELGYATMTNRSNFGTPQISGPAYGITHSWPIATMLTLDEALQLGALAKWQSRRYGDELDGKLRLIDEVELLDPEPAPHSKQLLTPLTPSWNLSYEHGYGVFDVILQLPPDWRQWLGRWTDTGEEARQATFVILEL